MELNPKYTFVPLIGKNNKEINNPKVQELLEKWGLKENVIMEYFSFNQYFQPYNKYHLAEAFLDYLMILSKTGNKSSCWMQQGISAMDLQVKQIPCSIISMSFFDKVRDPKNNIVHVGSDTICKTYDKDIDGFIVSDNLQAMLLDEECHQYKLYSCHEREEFIFKLFRILVLGGNLCQYEDTLEPYLNVVRSIYKDVIRVEKREDLYPEEPTISTIVLEVVINEENKFTANASNERNAAFLLIDGRSREITTLSYQFR